LCKTQNIPLFLTLPGGKAQIQENTKIAGFFRLEGERRKKAFKAGKKTGERPSGIESFAYSP